MKISTKQLFYLFLFIVLPAGVSAQKIHSGVSANSLFDHAEIVRESQFSSLPSYIKFRKSSQMDIDELKKWMVSNFKFDPSTSFNLIREDVDNLGHKHYRYQQTLNGLPIEDAIWIAHTNNDKVYSLNGLIYDKITTATAAGLSESAALTKALSQIDAEVYKWQLPGEEAHLKWETDDQDASYMPVGELVFVSANTSFLATDYRLAYKFNVYAHQPISRHDIYVDANTGEILREIELLCHADEDGVAHTAYSGEKDIVADSFGGEYRLRDGSRGDGVRTFDMNEGTSYGDAVDFIDDDNDWDNVNPELDEYATDAHWGSEMTYDYFLEEHGRNSIDNAGFQLNSYVHFDAGYDNAFWDGNRMTYGDGAFAFTPLTSIDVAGHEISHGLTTFTAGLVYAMESGALNESFSDIFGTAIEHFGRPEDANWLLGEDIGLSGPLRSLEDPNDRGDPDTYFGDFWADLDGGDSGGVHTNSGVQNFWYYLLSEGGSGTNDNGDDYDIDGIGIENASAVAFRNLTVYLTSSSQFADARFYAIESAIDLFGICTIEVTQTGNAWYAVGVGDIYNPVTEADFFAEETFGCTVPFTAVFINTSTSATDYEWDFGDGETSTDENPTHTYTAAGTYSVSLFASGGDCGTDEVEFVDYIIVDPTADCIVTFPTSGVRSTQTGCEGTIFDSGGEASDYGAAEDAQVTISPTGAESVSLLFPEFDVEEGDTSCDFDYLNIYDGPNEFSPLIGRYCNDNLPSDMTSSGPSITLVFHSDGFVEGAGFEINWICTLPEDEPDADFLANSSYSCNGTAYFVDRSSNSPTSWFWDFGDGGTSTDQNPMHTYLADGSYDVTLTATNIVGSDEHIEIDNITVELMEDPVTTGDNICEERSTTLLASGSSDLNWFENPSGGDPIFTGESFDTPVLDETTTYYVESHATSDPDFVGPDDNTFGGGGFFVGDQHLVFNCPIPVILKSVKVYANGAGERTIELRTNDGTVIESIVIDIPDGESRVNLGFQLPVGNDLQLGTTIGSSPAMYRNNDEDAFADYPFVLAESVEISSSSAGDQYYYFFYDWELVAYECLSDRVPVSATVVDCAGIDEASERLISIFPNPSNGIVNISTGNLESGSIRITDVVGRTIANISFNTNTFAIDLNDFHARGTYFVEFFDAESNLVTIRRVVKQ